MKEFLAAVFGLLFVADTYAATIEEWVCRDKYTSTGEILAEATVNEGRSSGTISVAGVTHKTDYRVAGFERRWDFGLRKDGSFGYSFVISPDGSATYYDFGSSNTAKPSIFMQCRQRPLSKDKK